MALPVLVCTDEVCIMAGRVSTAATHQGQHPARLTWSQVQLVIGRSKAKVLSNHPN